MSSRWCMRFHIWVFEFTGDACIFTCEYVYSHVWHGLFTCVSWPIHICDMTTWHLSMCLHMWCMYFHIWVCESTWDACIFTCEYLYSHMWHGLFTYVTWPIHIYDMTTWHLSMCLHIDVSIFTYEYVNPLRACIFTCEYVYSHVWRDLFTYVTWPIHICDMTTWHLSMCLQVWCMYFYRWVCEFAWNACIFTCEYDSFIYMTWLIHICVMTYSHVRHDFFTYVTKIIHTCDMTFSHMWHDLFTYMTWLIHTCDMTYSNMWHDFFTSPSCVTWPTACHRGRGGGGNNTSPRPKRGLLL